MKILRNFALVKSFRQGYEAYKQYNSTCNSMKILFNTTTLLSIAIAVLTSLSAKAQTTGDTLIFTTDKEIGEEIKFAVGTIADEGVVTIEGADGTWVNDKTVTYTLTEKTIKIIGDVGTFKCKEGKIKTIDVSICPKLRMLDIDRNEVEALDLANNPNLEKLSFQENKLSEIDVTTCSKLKWLACSYNRLTELNTASNAQLDWLNCSGNKLSTVDVQHNAALTGLLCSNMGLEKIDVSPCPELARLLCQNNKLSTLDVSNNKKLTELQCFGNELNEINIANNPDLERFSCSKNKLRTLDLTANTHLTNLSCFSNQLSALDVSACKELKYLYCCGNEIKGADMDNLISSMRSIPEADGNGTFAVINNTQTPDKNVCTKTQVEQASKKGWMAKELKGKKWVDYEGSEPTGVTNFEINAERTVSVYDASGRRISQPVRGLNIIKLQSGKTVKQIRK